MHRCSFLPFGVDLRVLTLFRCMFLICWAACRVPLASSENATLSHVSIVIRDAEKQRILVDVCACLKRSSLPLFWDSW